MEGNAPNDLPANNDVQDVTDKNKMIDVVFVLDLSDSMKPCIDNLAANLHALVAEVARGEGMSSAGVQVQVDWRIGIVGHNSLHNHDTEFYRLDITDVEHPTDETRVREILDQCGGMLKNSEATLHAMDWAMDNISWRGPGGYRRFLAVFTDEPVGGGDMAGISEPSWRDFMTKLFGFNVFLVAPVDNDPTPEFSFARIKTEMPSWLKGFQHVNGPRPEDWNAIDWTQLTSRLGKTMTTAEIPADAATPRPNVFQTTFPPAKVTDL